MGLNFSQLTCHFTSTANLTACQLPPATQWHAYTRASDASAAFDVIAGFLGAGDDARAPAELSVAGCEAACAGLASCRGFTFQAGAGAGVSSGIANLGAGDAPLPGYATTDMRVPALALQASSGRPAGQVKCHFKTAIRLTAEKVQRGVPAVAVVPAVVVVPAGAGARQDRSSGRSGGRSYHSVPGTAPRVAYFASVRWGLASPALAQCIAHVPVPVPVPVPLCLCLAGRLCRARW